MTTPESPAPGWMSTFSTAFGSTKGEVSVLDQGFVDALLGRIKSSSASLTERTSTSLRLLSTPPNPKLAPVARNLCVALLAIAKKGDNHPERILALDAIGALFEGKHVKDAKLASDVIHQLLKSGFSSHGSSHPDIVRIASWHCIRDVLVALGMGVLESTSLSQSSSSSSSSTSLFSELLKSLKPSLLDKSATVSAAAVDVCLALAPIVTVDALSDAVMSSHPSVTQQQTQQNDNDDNKNAGNNSNNVGNDFNNQPHPSDLAVSLLHFLSKEIGLHSGVILSSQQQQQQQQQVESSLWAHVQWRGSLVRAAAPAWGGLGLAYGTLLGFCLRVPSAYMLSRLPSSDVQQALQHIVQLWGSVKGAGTKSGSEHRLAVTRALVAFLDMLTPQILEQNLPVITRLLFSLLSTSQYKEVYGSLAPPSAASQQQAWNHTARVLAGKIGIGSLPTSEQGISLLDDTIATVSDVWRKHVITRLSESGKLAAIQTLATVGGLLNPHDDSASVPSSTTATTSIVIEISHLCGLIGQPVFGADLNWIELLMRMVPTVTSSPTAAEPLPMGLCFAVANLIHILATLHDRFTVFQPISLRLREWWNIVSPTLSPAPEGGSKGAVGSGGKAANPLSASQQTCLLQTAVLLSCAHPGVALTPLYLRTIATLIPYLLLDNAPSIIRASGWFLTCSLLRVPPSDPPATSTPTVLSSASSPTSSSLLFDVVGGGGSDRAIIDVITKALRNEFGPGSMKAPTVSNASDEPALVEYLLPRSIAANVAHLLSVRAAAAVLTGAAASLTTVPPSSSSSSSSPALLTHQQQQQEDLQRSGAVLSLSVGSVGALIKSLSQWLAPTQGNPIRINDASTESFVDGVLVVVFDAYSTIVRLQGCLNEHADTLRRFSIEPPSVPMRTLLNLVARQLMRGRSLPSSTVSHWLRTGPELCRLDDETHPSSLVVPGTENRSATHTEYTQITQISTTLLRFNSVHYRHQTLLQQFLQDSAGSGAGAATLTAKVNTHGYAYANSIATNTNTLSASPNNNFSNNADLAAFTSSGLFEETHNDHVHHHIFRQHHWSYLPGHHLLQLSLDLFADLFLTQPAENQQQLLKFFNDNVGALNGEARSSLQTNLLAALAATTRAHHLIRTAASTSIMSSSSANGSNSGGSSRDELGGRIDKLIAVKWGSALQAMRTIKSFNRVGSAVSSPVLNLMLAVSSPYAACPNATHRRLAADTLASLAEADESIHAICVKNLLVALNACVPTAASPSPSWTTMPTDWTVVGTSYTLGCIAQRVGGMRSRQYAGDVVKILLVCAKHVHTQLASLLNTSTNKSARSHHNISTVVLHLQSHLRWILYTMWNIMDSAGLSVAASSLANQTLSLMHHILSQGHGQVAWLTGDCLYYVGLVTSAVVQVFGPDLQFDPRLLDQVMGVVHVIEFHHLGLLPLPTLSLSSLSPLNTNTNTSTSDAPTSTSASSASVAPFRKWAASTVSFPIKTGSALWYDPTPALIRERLLLFAPFVVMNSQQQQQNVLVDRNPASSFVRTLLACASSTSRFGGGLQALSSAPLRAKSLQALRLVAQLNPNGGLASVDTLLYLLYELDKEPVEYVRAELRRLIGAIDDILTVPPPEEKEAKDKFAWANVGKVITLGTIHEGPSDPRVYLGIMQPSSSLSSPASSVASPPPSSSSLAADEEDEEQQGTGIMGGGQKSGPGFNKARSNTSAAAVSGDAASQWSASSVTMAIVLQRVVATLHQAPSTSASSADSAALAREFSLEDIVSMAFKGCSGVGYALKVQGLCIVHALLDQFGETPDPDYQEHRLLELHRAQISSALRQAMPFSAASSSASSSSSKQNSSPAQSLGPSAQDSIARAAFASMARFITWVSLPSSAQGEARQQQQPSSALRNLINPLLIAGGQSLPATSPAHKAWLLVMAWLWSNDGHDNDSDEGPSSSIPILLRPFISSTTASVNTNATVDGATLLEQLSIGWTELLEACKPLICKFGLDLRVASADISLSPSSSSSSPSSISVSRKRWNGFIDRQRALADVVGAQHHRRFSGSAFTEVDDCSSLHLWHSIVRGLVSVSASGRAGPSSSLAGLMEGIAFYIVDELDVLFGGIDTNTSNTSSSPANSNSRDDIVVNAPKLDIIGRCINTCLYAIKVCAEQGDHHEGVHSSSSSPSNDDIESSSSRAMVWGQWLRSCVTVLQKIQQHVNQEQRELSRNLSAAVASVARLLLNFHDNQEQQRLSTTLSSVEQGSTSSSSNTTVISMCTDLITTAVQLLMPITGKLSSAPPAPVDTAVTIMTALSPILIRLASPRKEAQHSGDAEKAIGTRIVSVCLMRSVDFIAHTVMFGANSSTNALLILTCNVMRQIAAHEANGDAEMLLTMVREHALFTLISTADPSSSPPPPKENIVHAATSLMSVILASTSSFVIDKDPLSDLFVHMSLRFAATPTPGSGWALLGILAAIKVALTDKLQPEAMTTIECVKMKVIALVLEWLAGPSSLSYEPFSLLAVEFIAAATTVNTAVTSTTAGEEGRQQLSQALLAALGVVLMKWWKTSSSSTIPLVLLIRLAQASPESLKLCVATLASEYVSQFEAAFRAAIQKQQQQLPSTAMTTGQNRQAATTAPTKLKMAFDVSKFEN